MSRDTQDYAGLISRIRIQGFHLLRLYFPVHSASSYQAFMTLLQPLQCLNSAGLGCCAFARHYLRNHFCFLLLWVLRCFSSPRSFPLKGMSDLTPDGLPHSDIPESQVICTYTGLFAACHVLLRLREPRHPPSALAYFRSSCPFDLNGQADFLFLLSFLSSRFAFSNMSKIFFFVENNGVEPLTLCVQSRCSGQLS